MSDSPSAVFRAGIVPPPGGGVKFPAAAAAAAAASAATPRSVRRRLLHRYQDVDPGLLFDLATSRLADSRKLRDEIDRGASSV